MHNSKERKHMISGSDKNNIKGKEKKEEGNFSMKTLTPTRRVVGIGTLEG